MPVWMGGYADPASDRAGRLADGHIAGAQGVAWARQAVASFRAAAARRGRGPGSLPTAALLYAVQDADVAAAADRMNRFFAANYGRRLFDPAEHGLVGPAAHSRTDSRSMTTWASTCSWKARIGARFGAPIRLLVDVTGPLSTVVVEIEYRDLAHFDELQRREQEMYGGAEFDEWFAGWSAVTELGTRELYRVVE